MTERTFRSRLQKRGLSTSRYRGQIRVARVSDTRGIPRKELRLTEGADGWEVLGPMKTPRPDFYGSYSSFEELLDFIEEYFFGEFPRDWRKKKETDR